MTNNKLVITILFIYCLIKSNTASDFIITTNRNRTEHKDELKSSLSSSSSSTMTTEIKCVDNSFDIVINDKPIVEYTNIRINYEIHVLLNKNVNIDKLEYASKCLKSIIFKYNRQSLIFKSTTTPKQIEIKFDLKLKSSIGIGNLDYLKEYSFELAYKQLNSQNEEVVVNLNEKSRNFHITTCFGRPGMPENLQCKSLRDEDTILCEWQRSQNVNSPDICYYEIVIAELNDMNNGSKHEKKMVKHETNENKFLIDTKKHKNITFFLSAINDAKCYLTFYPAVKECKYERVASKYYTVNIQLDNDDLSSMASSTTRPSVNGLLNFRMNIIDSMSQTHSEMMISSSTQSINLYVNKNETNKNALNFFLLFLVFILIKIFILIF